ncbi:MAG: hypothetical protein ACLRSE_12205 [Alistipes finegoldii]
MAYWRDWSESAATASSVATMTTITVEYIIIYALPFLSLNSPFFFSSFSSTNAEAGAMQTGHFSGAASPS